MATNTAAAPDFDFTVRAMLGTWKTISQNERVIFYKQSIKTFDDPQINAQASDILAGIGDKVIETDKAFLRIRNTLEDFAKNNRNRHPELETEYVPGWRKLYDEWFNAYKKSQDYASLVAAEYKDRYVGVILELVSKVDLDNPASVRREQQRLREYSQEAPPSVIPVDYEKAFKMLREDVARFQEQFNQYLVQQGEKLEREIQRLQGELDALVKRLNELNKAVDDWTIALAATSWLGLIGLAITGSGLAAKTSERNAKAREVKDKKEEMERANNAQAGLAKMVTEFAALGGDFDQIDGTLQQLTQIWSDMRSSSIKFSHLLERAMNGGDDADEFHLALESALKAAEPLSNSLSRYATRVNAYTKAHEGAGKKD